MGDRAVYGFREHSAAPTLYLYSHWGGDEQDLTLGGALIAAKNRWGDAAYATRICVSHIIGDEWKNETGYGLSVDTYSFPDYDYINVVDWQSQKVIRINVQVEYNAQTKKIDRFASEEASVSIPAYLTNIAVVGRWNT